LFAHSPCADYILKTIVLLLKNYEHKRTQKELSVMESGLNKSRFYEIEIEQLNFNRTHKY